MDQAQRFVFGLLNSKYYDFYILHIYVICTIVAFVKTLCDLHHFAFMRHSCDLHHFPVHVVAFAIVV